MTNPKGILEVAKSFLGQDASPHDEAPDELGCAETVSDILFDAGCTIPITVSTLQLCHFLETSKDWQEVADPLPGDVIISPTGSGRLDSPIKHGHTGIVFENAVIGSNDSATGEFQTNWTVRTWKKHWGDQGGYPVKYFRFIGSQEPEIEPTEEEKVAVAAEGLEVAREAAKYPQLRGPIMTFLASLIQYLKK